jgi:hypothetical protein
MMSSSSRKPKKGQSEANKLLPQDRAVHDWYRFVLSFPPHLVRQCVDRFGLSENDLVLDPFCGTGTTLVECKKLGIPSAGIEPNAIAFFASRVKVDWTPKTQSLLEHTCLIAEATNQILSNEGIYDDELANFDGYSPLPEQLLSLSPEQFSLLLTDSISPLPLHKSLRLLAQIEAHRDSRFYAHERLAFACALVNSIGNLHFGPEVGVGPAKPDAPVIPAWQHQIRKIANDLETLRHHTATRADVTQADARQLSNVLEPGSVSAVITSPPYPNEKDYTRTTRLESVLLGFLTDKASLQQMKRTLLRSNTRNVYKGDDDDCWIAEQTEVQRIADAIEARRIEMGKTSGFERLYAKVTRLYFGGMARHLADLRQILRPGAQLAYVVGDQASYLRVPIRTGQILADIATSLGYEVQSIDLFRTRLATATKEQLREEVVVFRWPGAC